jgi:hypothetical protein
LAGAQLLKQHLFLVTLLLLLLLLLMMMMMMLLLLLMLLLLSGFWRKTARPLRHPCITSIQPLYDRRQRGRR